jgi:heme/copper-type cytochrome/quinol oxidase subunit 4
MLVHYEEMTQYKTAKHSLLVYIIPWKMELAKALSVLRVCTITCADVSKKDVTKKAVKECGCVNMYVHVCINMCVCEREEEWEKVYVYVCLAVMVCLCVSLSGVGCERVCGC